MAAYLDAKFHLSKDLRVLLFQREIAKEVAQRSASSNLKSHLSNADSLEIEKNGQLSPWYLFAEHVETWPDDICIWSRDKTYTWKEAHDQASRYAQYFLSLGVRPQQLVAMYLLNSADFIVIWLALWSIGCAPALVNNSIHGDGLVHCLNLSSAEIAIVDDEEACLGRALEVRDRIVNDLNMKFLVLDETLRAKIGSIAPRKPEKAYLDAVRVLDSGCIIYTRYAIHKRLNLKSTDSSSGTTGLPKAVSISIERFLLSGAWHPKLFNQISGRNGDRWYMCLPLFHGTAGLSSIFCMLAGRSIAIGRKFSVRNFWPEIIDSKSTFFVYVGETVRYLLAAPPSELEKKHSIRAIYGNGLRPDVWDKVSSRFNIPEIIEFFNSTEGMLASSNLSRNNFSAHAVGHHGLILRKLLHNIRVPVSVNPDTNEINRDPTTGLAIRTSYAEGGEILVAHPNPGGFEGYFRNPKATNSKIVHDILQHGDSYARSGDALRRDENGHWFFMDRLGDTYRWKSENVSTAEVSEAIGRFPGIHDANVYGVLVPRHDGRAGCAALFFDGEEKNFDFGALLMHLKAMLPAYAIPVFLRIVKKAAVTVNLKQSKVGLREEGIELGMFGSKDPAGKEDKLLWRKPGGNGYVRFTEQDLEALKSGAVSL